MSVYMHNALHDALINVIIYNKNKQYLESPEHPQLFLTVCYLQH